MSDDDDQLELFRKTRPSRQDPTILRDDFSNIMPNFTGKALHDLAAAGERDEDNPYRWSGARAGITGPVLKKFVRSEPGEGR